MISCQGPLAILVRHTSSVSAKHRKGQSPDEVQLLRGTGGGWRKVCDPACIPWIPAKNCWKPTWWAKGTWASQHWWSVKDACRRESTECHWPFRFSIAWWRFAYHFILLDTQNLFCQKLNLDVVQHFYARSLVVIGFRTIF